MTSHPATTSGDSPAEDLNPARSMERDDTRGQGAAALALRQQKMEVELNRFHGALREVRHELRDARRSAMCAAAKEIEEALREEDALLRDSLVLLEVERTILDERLPAEHALSKVLDERWRLARLVGGESTSPPGVASLVRAFRRVTEALGAG